MFNKGSSTVSPHPKLHTYQEGYLLPVLSADELLFSARHKGLLRQFRDLAGLPQNEFDSSYGELIQHFMEFTQVLPHQMGGALGSLLNYGIARTSAVFQKYCQIRKTQTTPLLKFAVFSAALLKDIGRVMSNQHITLTDEEGEFMADWNPLSGSMIHQSKFYKLYSITTTYLKIESEITLLLARQLMSRELFLWLSSDVAIFSDWLAALLNEEGVGSKEITWALALIKRDDILMILNTLDGASVETHEPSATEYGEAFYRWLKNGIHTGEIAVNSDDANVQVVAEGVLVEKQLFKQFVDLAKLPVNFAVVYTQFGNAMGIVNKGGSDFLHAAYFSPVEGGGNFRTFSSHITQKNRSSHEGMVVDSKMIFINKETPAVSTLKSIKTLTNEAQQKSSVVSSVIKSTLRTTASG